MAHSFISEPHSADPHELLTDKQTATRIAAVIGGVTLILILAIVVSAVLA
ncbi:MAG: hypothetical protein V7721_06650 [Porticoccaceae bacterium]